MAFSSVDAQRKYRESVRIEIRKAKEVPCMDCGEGYPFYVMDFDHRPDEVKLYNVNKMPGRQGIDRVLEEIAKCDVVCSNCHRSRTYGRIQ